jgi:DNA polymerase
MITLDFETFYSKEYSLSTLTTEEYIRDPRFEVIGVAVQVDDQPGEWFSGDFADVLMFLRRFEMEKHAVASHNAMFDMAILGWKFGIYPAMVVDTMSMAKALYGIERSCSLAKLAEHYGLPAKGTEVHNALGLRRADMTMTFLASYGDYCIHDAWLCRELFKLMRSQLPREELASIDWTIQCYSRPTLVIDRQRALQELQDYRQTKAATLHALGVTQEALRSDDVMAGLLGQLGVEAPRKLSPKRRTVQGTPMEVWAFARSDTEFMDLLEHEDPQVAALVEARLAMKSSIVETRLQTFADIASRGPLPYPLAYASAQPTLRWQAWKQQRINLQNLPRAKTGSRSPLRDAIKAPPGFKLGVIDLSQIELRVQAWQAGQLNILAMLERGEDVYCHNAAPIYGYAVNKKEHPDERFVGKVCTLSAQYGVGGRKFALMLRIAARRDGRTLPDESDEFGERCITGYRDNNPRIRSFWYQANDALALLATGGAGSLGPYTIFGGSILLPDGMTMRYPNLRHVDDMVQARSGWVYDKFMGRGSVPKWIYGAMLTENLAQRVARGVMRDGMLRLRTRYWVCGSVHDELIFLVPEHEPEEQAIDFAVESLTQRMPWAPNMPLAAECKIGRCYGDVKS